jgi:hypothetical protein
MASVIDAAKRQLAVQAEQYRHALPRSIPDDPNYERYVPIEYRLDAKAIVGDLAQDLSKGQSAHVYVEAAHWGIAAAEMFELVEALALAGPVLAFVGSFMALGVPYMEAAEHLANEWSASGFSRGAVMGADRRRGRQVIETFGNLYFPPNDQFPRGRDVSVANYRAGLAAGYLQGRMLTENQRKIFWRDLGRRMGDQSYRGPHENWGARQWSDWYADVAAVFRRYHLVPVH